MIPSAADIKQWMQHAKRRQFRSEFAKKLIPQTHWGDQLVSTVRFIGRHHRFPTKRNLWNNHIHRHKASGALRSELCERVTDKEHVKDFVKDRLGPGHTVPTLGVVRRPQDLVGHTFPDDCCIKSTHGSGQVMFRRAGGPLDYKTLVGWFYHNHYLRGREANYCNLDPKLIVEPILYDGTPFAEYRFYCVQGQVRGIWVETDRFTQTRSALYDFDFKEVYRWKSVEEDTKTDVRPDTLDSMLDAARALSVGFNLVRVDMMSDGTSFYVGELTNCDGNALATFPSLYGEALAAHFVFGGPPDPILSAEQAPNAPA